MDDFCGSPFWDSKAAWETDDPDLTICFEKTVLVWIPCSFLWILLPLEIYYLRHSNASDIPLNFYNVAKLITIAILASLALTDIVHYLAFNYSPFPVNFYSPVIKFVTYALFFGLTYANIKCGVRSSAVLFTFSLLLVICGGPQFRTELRSGWTSKENLDTIEFVSYVIYYPAVLMIFVMNCFADARPTLVMHHVSEASCPEKQSSILSQLLYGWFDPLAWKGYKKPLENDDLWSLDYNLTSAGIIPKFQKHWNKDLKRVKKASDLKTRSIHENRELLRNEEGNIAEIEYTTLENTKSASILPALCRTFGPTFVIGTIFKCLVELLTFVSPQLLSLLIDFVSNEEEMWKGYLYAVLLFIVAFIHSVISAQYVHKMYIVGFQMRTCLISVIYQKALRISNGAKKKFTVGETVNLMSVDAQKFVDLMAYLYLLITTPIQVVLALYFLWQILGPSVLAGLAVMIISSLINGYVVSKMKNLQIKQMKYKDDRIKLMNEILSGFKVLKLYAWETSFENQVLRIRTKETNISKKQAYFMSVSSFIFGCSTFAVSLATYGVFVLSSEKNIFDAKTAFVSLSLFNILRIPLMIFPTMVTNLVQSIVSIKRINKFLNCEDLNFNDVTHEYRAEALVIEKGSFSWERAQESPTLRDIDIKVSPGALVAVVGSVGAGKSSLISAFLGEMYKMSGAVNTRGTIAYVPQQAWIQNATLRDNITFGNSLNKSYYNQVLEACALKPDLEMLPGGDSIEIGEKGINLSGGQKQRISLARAVYYGADVYLLDDPLSAVDSHVGKHIFEHVIGPKGMLKTKTRVLVTHSITYLSQVDFIVVLKEGSISESGTFNQLLNDKGDFSEFLLSYLGESMESDEEDLDDFKKILGEEKVASERLMRQKSRTSESDSTKSYLRQRTVTNETDDSIKKRKNIEEDVTAEKLIEIEHTETGNFALRLMRQKSRTSEGDSTKSYVRQRTVTNETEDSIKKRKNIEEDVTGEKLIEIERTETGNIKWQVYAYYLRSAGYILTLVIICLNFLINALSVTSNMWISKWSSDTNATNPDGTQVADKRDLYLSVYAILGLIYGCTLLVDDIATRLGCWRSAKALHNYMLKNVFLLPLSFMDVTPSGRILSRFSKDVDVLDNTLPEQIGDFIFCLGEVLSTLFIITYTTPAFAIVIVPISAVYYFFQRFYVTTSRQLKRLESVSRSPIYSKFMETVVGAQSIRAYGLSDNFIKQSEEKVDFNQKSYYLSIVSERWLSVRSETIGNAIIFFAALFAVLGRDTLSPGLVGLSVSYALQITSALNWLVYMTSEVETNIVAVERIKEYSETPREAPWKIENESVPQNWPSKGDIVFQDFQVRYRPGLELVLKGISFYIEGGQKVGIVGRTGAGKSSLTLSLFRIIESAGGKIIIDGVDIATLGLHTLRSKLTIIPQDPVLFCGSLRMNLDPANEYSDNSIYRALELAHLKSHVSTLVAGLQHEVTEGGENFSVGQRQLICLARALLRKTKVLILDEATAAIDLETDDLIQSTIRKEFKDCTVLTIAHRLNTIMDYDKIVVLDKGYLVEYNSPKVLLESKNSVFYGMAADAGLT